MVKEFLAHEDYVFECDGHSGVPDEVIQDIESSSNEQEGKSEENPSSVKRCAMFEFRASLSSTQSQAKILKISQNSLLASLFIESRSSWP